MSKKFIVFTALLMFLFPNVSFALRGVAYDESHRKPQSPFEALDKYHQEIVLDAILPGFPLPGRQEVKDCIAKIMLGRATVDEAMAELKQLFPKRGAEEETIYEALKKVPKTVSIADHPSMTHDPSVLNEDDIVVEMTARLKSIFEMISTEVDGLLKEGKRGTIATFIDNRLAALPKVNATQYPPDAISALRFLLGERFVHASQHALAIRVLQKGIPEEGQCHLAYRVRYHHLLGLAYEAEGSRMVIRGIRIDQPHTMEQLMAAEKNFETANELSIREETELSALAIPANQEQERKNALRGIGYFRKIIDADNHQANYKIISALGLTEPAKIDQDELARRGGMVWETDVRGDESFAARNNILRTIVATYIVLKENMVATKLSLKHLAQLILVSMPQKELTIRRLGKRVDLMGLKQEARMALISGAESREALGSI